MSHNTYTIMVLPKTITVDFFGLYEYDIDNLIKKLEQNWFYKLVTNTNAWFILAL